MVAIIRPTMTLLIQSDQDEADLIREIENLGKNGLILCTEIIILDDPLSGQKIYLNNNRKNAETINDFLDYITTIKTDIISYIPRGLIPRLSIPKITSNFLAPWVSLTTLPQETASEILVDGVGWILSTSLAKIVLPQLGGLENWTVLAMANALEINCISFDWKGVCASATSDLITYQIKQAKIPNLKPQISTSLTINSRVLALVPHYHCEVWLERCLRGLVSQTCPLDNIVVIDDGSEQPPVRIIEKFPNVTLLTSPINVGPYRLVQQVIEDTNYEAYLFQDADDWSSCDRLEKLLHAAVISGAELIGTQEFRVYEEQSKLTPVCYPLDVNRALAEKPGHPLLHPSSLVTRDLVMRLGGFATGLKFGGDTEFLLRAALVARIVNVPDYCYFRRKRSGSLTTSPDTGLNSPARLQLLMTLKNRAYANYAALKEGRQPELSPLVKAEPLQLCHVTGPALVGLRQTPP
ncbi:MAG TPA: hypothetical protein DDZ80_14705 [Cyanobacteria bacterium UBA8803]|nr:hypothetical protein [Cyanobacteria bacterium UBA9273]HBL59683.1 hypothetical protein [Cyanobacteria bacterium UBA8803]